MSGFGDRAGTAASSMMSRLERLPHNGQLAPHPRLSAPHGADHYDPMRNIPYPHSELAPPKLDPRQFNTAVIQALSNQAPDSISPLAGPRRPPLGFYGYEMPKLSSLIDRLAPRIPVVGAPARDYHAQFAHARGLGISRPGERTRIYDSPEGSPPTAAQLARDHAHQQDLALGKALDGGYAGRDVADYTTYVPPKRAPSRERIYDP